MSSRHSRLPQGWDDGRSDDGGASEATGDEFEYFPLRLPPDVTRLTASMRLAIEAEFGGWELSRVRLYNDGSRRVLLKRRKTALSVLSTARPGI